MCRLLAAETICKDRIVAAQNELAALRASLASITPSAQSAIDQTAKSECLELTQQVIIKLPREIRDTIYLYLSARDGAVIEREHYRVTQDPLTNMYSYDFERCKADRFPEHYWSKEYVSESFFQELAENHYRMSTFVFNDDAEVMKRFLTTDDLKLGILPKDLVSSVEIRIHTVRHDRGCWRSYLWGEPKSPAELREGMSGVFDLKDGAHVVVRLVTEAETEVERDERCDRAISVLLDEMQCKRMKKYKMELVIADRQEWEYEVRLREHSSAIYRAMTRGRRLSLRS